MGYKVRNAFIVITLFVLGAGLILIFSRQLFSRSVRGEAQLLIGYIHTLERVYRIETKEYAGWDQFYGSNLEGSDHCRQPESAAELGFLVAGCHKEKSNAPRYAYRVMKIGDDRYKVEAKSGSDSQKRSFVCFSPGGEEIWESTQNREINLVKSCP